MRCLVVVIVLYAVSPVFAESNYRKAVEFLNIIHVGQYKKAIQYASVGLDHGIGHSRPPKAITECVRKL